MSKKALLVGINDYPRYRLKGCVNDVKQMDAVLRDLYDFDSDNIKILLNREATQQAIINGLKWLAEGGTDTAVRIFHYAGHGYSLRDLNGDEEDKYDEALAPYDFLQKRFVIDDELKKLYESFPQNGNLTLIMDSCHSGTIQRDPQKDLRYRFIPNPKFDRQVMVNAQKKRERAKREYVMKAVADARDKNLSDADFGKRVATAMKQFDKLAFGVDSELSEGNVLLAACQSFEKAADDKIGRNYHGAFTYYLVKILRAKGGRITHGELIKKVGEALKAKGYEQTPQLECDPGKEKAKMLAKF